jgi:GNAT superfamily N-acetyltransferase/predicted nucleotidyltransferase
MRPARSLARDIARRYGALSQVEAVALAGSHVAGTPDDRSDIDLYVYSRTEISTDARAAISTAQAKYAEIDNRFWEPGDEWVDVQTGIHVDVTFRSVEWIEEQLNRVLRVHQASVGYSTCLWHNVLGSQALYDRDGWFADLQRRARQPYPEELRQAILAKNHPILRRSLSSYAAQLTKAVDRGDWVSVNHRVTQLLASYFDCLFALNRLPHPGEKRLVEIASRLCDKTPVGMSEQVRALIQAGSRGDQAIVAKAEALAHGLDELLVAEGFDPASVGCSKGENTPRTDSGETPAGKIAIRSATAADAPIVMQFLDKMVRELASMGDHPVSENREQWAHMASDIQGSLGRTDSIHLLAETTSPVPMPVGWAYARIVDREPIYEPARVLHISALYVSAPHRRTGIGQTLLKALLEWGQGSGCVEAELNVLVGNPACSLYDRFGFSASHVKMTRKL